MKKIITLISAQLLIIQNCGAYISGKTIIKEQQVYCPSEISCEVTNDISSCNFISKYKHYWNSVTVERDAKIVSGTYRLARVLASYHAPSKPSGSCRYNDPNGQKEIMFVVFNDFSSLEASYVKPMSWSISGSGAECLTSNTHACPLHKTSMITIHDNNIRTELQAKINGKSIQSGNSKLPPYNLYIKYDDALAGCSGKLCKIDLSSSKGAIYGSVTVDMDNKLQIVSISETRPSEVEINQIKQVNAVEIKYHD